VRCVTKFFLLCVAEQTSSRNEHNSLRFFVVIALDQWKIRKEMVQKGVEFFNSKSTSSFFC